MFNAMGAFGVALKGHKGDVTPASVLSTIKSMPWSVVPGTGGLHFRCNGKADPTQPAVCSNATNAATLDATGKPATYTPVNDSRDPGLSRPSTEPRMPTVDIPWIVSVDDHVIEPPSLWVSRLPAKYRDVGPRVERLPAGELALAGAQVRRAAGHRRTARRLLGVRGPLPVVEARRRGVGT